MGLRLNSRRGVFVLVTAAVPLLIGCSGDEETFGGATTIAADREAAKEYAGVVAEFEEDLQPQIDVLASCLAEECDWPDRLDAMTLVVNLAFFQMRLEMTNLMGDPVPPRVEELLDRTKDTLADLSVAVSDFSGCAEPSECADAATEVRDLLDELDLLFAAWRPYASDEPPLK